ncbi:helix-turn-helix domain-containing protein [Streptomyces aidingensis]|uniref:Helix-turn-helix n=1 Tax=Streptomyces aidingensis TaxID=910347 RepID=A0A1I1TGZ1_9ACTN|nr:helix-turn-helix transcriptional regulator [Streptomyces aidingensis]SFD56418.1 Helix-turn-helix [Streptomyces aidingensis]
MVTKPLAPGANVARLRKERGWSQAKLARKAGVSLSLLSKVEVGDRTLTPSAAASLGHAMGVSMADILGPAPLTPSDESIMENLRNAMRDYDLPQMEAPPEGEVDAEIAQVNILRDNVNLSELMPILPPLLRKATALAVTLNDAHSWTALAEVYSAIYWLAARHRWMDLAEVAVSRERWASEQKRNPLSEAVAARDRAGTYLNFGDVENGLILIDRAIASAESRLSGDERDLAVGILNLRGMTLAGRLTDDKEAKREANRHIASALQLSARFNEEHRIQGCIFGPKNTFVHHLATLTDLRQQREALKLTEDLDSAMSGLPPTRVAPTYITAARAHLDVHNMESALQNLQKAWDTAPQLARIHPMWQEVLRVADSRHKRSNPRLNRLLKLSGIAAK